MLNSTERFSSRVENYVKYRPAYPPAVIELLRGECGLTSDSKVADIGSGTGILTELLLQNGNPVTGVEPNQEMREAGERLLSKYPHFLSISGTAEATMLEPRSVDVITAGQAFHWFDRTGARKEFVRILKPGGWVALVWNDRNVFGRPFFQEYENLLLRYGTDYEAVGHRHVDAKSLADFFAPADFKQAHFSNQQVFDFTGLKGRLLSSSYAPEAGHPNHIPMLDALDAIFKKYQSDGNVVFEYDTTVYYSRLS